jgi:hypothetical protein
MELKVIAAVIPFALLAAAPAKAHYHLDQPPSMYTQDTQGNPQKPANMTDMCPAGTASGMVTQVRAGGLVHVKITETVPHGGHYRVSFAQSAANLSFPNTTVTNNQCISTTIQQTPTLPVLADGLWAHTQAQADAKNFCNGTATCETDVTIPANTAPGMYVMQVIEWMTPHGSAANNGAYGCFYAHCSTIQVVDADAGLPDGGVVIVDSGTPTNDSGAPTSDGGGGGNGSDTDGGGTTGGNKNNPKLADTGDGCSISSANASSLALPMIGAIAVLGIVRRRKRS